MTTNFRKRLDKILEWYMERILNKWDKKAIPCSDAKELATQKIISLIESELVGEDIEIYDYQAVGEYSEEIPVDVTSDENKAVNEYRQKIREKLK